MRYQRWSGEGIRARTCTGTGHVPLALGVVRVAWGGRVAGTVIHNVVQFDLNRPDKCIVRGQALRKSRMVPAALTLRRLRGTHDVGHA